MTDNKAFKKAVRQRMARTGEPHNTARRAVLARTRAEASSSTADTTSARTLQGLLAMQKRVTASAYAPGLQFKGLTDASNLRVAALTKGLADAASFRAGLQFKGLTDSAWSKRAI